MGTQLIVRYQATVNNEPLFTEHSGALLRDVRCTAAIHFPIHTSPRYAKRVGLDGIILQGTATSTLAVRELVACEAAGDPRRLRSLTRQRSKIGLHNTD